MTQQTYLPAAGLRWLLPLYDPFCRLAGVQRIHRQLIEHAAPRPGHRVLEIGCGTGTLLTALARTHPGVEAIGIDPDPAALRRARRKAARNQIKVNFQRAYAGSLPLPDASVDRVLSALMLHHLERAEHERALREARRVLLPGGELHVLDLVADHVRPSRLAATEPDRVLTAMFDAGLTQPVELARARVAFGRVVFYRASA
ncbi:class I SAM-dependent methyltransferase [Actinoplanes sp. NPDC020271]|uniref:class I SAM-dependent methyltransferase n=1 Tax=Actinoplanes sp. NPDC020271 TaxID=3363896 RepID=UPI0037B29068